MWVGVDMGLQPKNKLEMKKTLNEFKKCSVNTNTVTTIEPHHVTILR